MCPAIAGQFLLADQGDQAGLTSCTFTLLVFTWSRGDL